MALAEPDRMALEIAHRALATDIPLEDMLKNRTHAVVLKMLARRHVKSRARVDLKKLQANDND